MKKELSISLVLYNNEESDITRLVKSIGLISSNFDLYIVDNSDDDRLRKYFLSRENFQYLKLEDNEGFAKGHNRILRKIKDKYKYHLIINPDVYFNSDVVRPIIAYLEHDLDTMQIVPKILNEDQSIQFTYKYEPRPFDLFARRFLPNNWFASRKENLSKKISLNGEVTEIPIMSGCFMFFRTEILHEIGYLDERFFLYMEDIDFSKRISSRYKSVYFPEVSIIHRHTQGSYNSRYLMHRHMASAIKYYNKHGWYPLW